MERPWKCDSCDGWDEEAGECVRVGVNGEVGVCWMEKTEGEY